ncbi:MAG: glutamate--cysteine ligase [Magnetospiraceae bacterium]
MPLDASTPITEKTQLVEYFEGGCKPSDQWRIGTEHEKFVYRLDDLRPLDYEGPRGVRDVLERLSKFGWTPIYEGDNLIALKDEAGASITLEPGGQLELSGAPLPTIHATCREVGQHLDQARDVARTLQIGMLGMGYQPKWAADDVPWMPKGRYKIMRNYMPKVGGLGLDMMVNTCTVQVNLDFESEACMVAKFRVGLALQPVATALFANSPFRHGIPTGYVSYRSHVWTDVDPDRTGMLPFVFEDGFGFERYVDYLLDVPMYFVYRDGTYIDAAGQSFRDFMAGRLPALPGALPTLKDWEDHLTTAFPEVRLKRYLEMRGTDGGPWGRLCALPALWTGLLYDKTALGAAMDLIQDWTIEEHDMLRREVPKHGLLTEFRGSTVGDLALEVLDMAHEGLKNRNMQNRLGQDETIFLNPLFRIAESNQTPAEELLFAYQGRWRGSVDPVFKEFAY